MNTPYIAPQQKEKLLYLESLRGIAALIVALFHAQFLQGSLVTDSFLRHGYLMVDFFFVLSGYVIALNYYDRIKSLQNIWVFQARRFLRLYPLHIMTFLVFVGIECAKYIFEINAGVVANNPAFTKNDWWAGLQHITLTHSLFQDEGTFNEPSWSISAEFYTYLIFAFLLLLKSDIIRKIMFVTGVVIAGTYGLWQPTLFPNAPLLMEDFVRCIYCFFIGVVVYLALRNTQWTMPSFMAFIGVAGAFSILVLRPYIDGALIPIIFAFAILTLVKTDKSLVKSLLEKPVLVFLGTISYGIYMWHEAVWWVMNNGLKYVAKVPQILHEPSGKKIMDLADFQIYGILIFGIGATVILSWLSYKLIEMPINKYRHNLRLK